MKGLTGRLGLLGIIAAGTLLITATPAFANSIVVWDVWHISAFSNAYIMSRGILLLVVVLLEAAIIRKVTSVEFPEAFRMMLVLNLASALLGFVISFINLGMIMGELFVLLFLASWIGILVWMIIVWKRVPSWYNITALVIMVVGFAAFPWTFTGYYLSKLYIYKVFVFFVWALPALGLTIFSKGAIALYYQDVRNVWKGLIIANLVSYILIAAFLPFTGMVAESGRDPAFESRAKSTLRSTGSSQLAYQGTNKERLYGSFDALVDSLYIAEGYTLGNMIENYSMSWGINHVSTVQQEGLKPTSISTFTIIAWPNYPARNLQTFAITEDQVVRTFNPKADNQFENVKTWDPIL